MKVLGSCTKPQALVYEWVGGGNLKSMLLDPKRLASFPLQQRVLCFRGVARGLAALHSGHENPIRHKDVKPENVLLVEGHCDAKLADCGVAKEQESSTTASSGFGRGTYAYICPVAMKNAV